MADPEQTTSDGHGWRRALPFITVMLLAAFLFGRAVWYGHQEEDVGTTVAADGDGPGETAGDGDEAPDGAALVQSWAHPRGPGLTGASPVEVPDAAELRWKVAFEGGVYCGPAIAAGVVYLGTGRGRCAALDAGDGTEHWNVEVGSSVTGVLVHDGRLLVSTGMGTLHALDIADGSELWRAEIEGEITGGLNLAIGDDSPVVVVGSQDFNLYGYTFDDGFLMWEYETENYINGTPAVHGDKAVAGGCDSFLHVVDVDTGEAAEGVAVNSYIGGSPAIAWPRCYVGTYEGILECANLADGEYPWTFDIGEQVAFFSTPAVGPEHVVFGARDGVFYCLDRASGEKVWEFVAGGGEEDGAPVIAGGRAVLGSVDGRVYVVELASGEEVWQYDTGGAVIGSPAIGEGLLVVPSSSGTVFAFEAGAE